MSKDDLEKMNFELVPNVDINFNSTTITDIFHSLMQFKETKAKIDLTANMKPEGVVIRNKNREKIFKIRFEDYQKAFDRQFIELNDARL